MDELSVAEPTRKLLTDPAAPADVDLSTPGPPADSAAPPLDWDQPPPRPSRPWITGAMTVSVLVVIVGYVWLQLNPHLLLANNTPSGGDMGAHVWGPAYLRDHLLPHFRLTGWTNDWYDGFPAYQYYMVAPALAIVALNAVFPYGVAFKLITVSGLLLLPLAAYVMGRLFRLRFPGPALLAVATVPFLFDTSFTIYGGNIASTLAGEFAFTISLVIMLVYLGFLSRGLETGRYRVITAVLFALVALCHPIPLLGMASLGTLAIVSWYLVHALFAEQRGKAVRSTLWWTVSTVGLGSALSAFWIVPFLMRHTYFNDMGWEKLPAGSSRMLYYLLHFGNETGQLKGLDLLSTVPLLWLMVLGLAAAGVVLSWVYRQQLGCVLSLVGLGLVLMFKLLPQGWLWNARLLPFWYLTVYFLAAVGVYHVVQLARTTPVRAGVVLGALAIVLLSVSLPLGVLPGSHRTADGRWTTMGLTAKESFVKSWAKWNYEGYEGKTAYPEYYQVVTKMSEIGKTRGCGRTMWEYDNDRLNSYGTPMSLMLLPYWTNGCIGSQEGLYFEASSTTPYHFLMQSELSTRPSRPQRKLQYSDLDMTLGVKHMQLMGVRYYMAFTERAVSEADRNPDLLRIATVGGDAQRVKALKASPTPDQAAIDRASPWVIYEVRNAPLVQGLNYQPVVVTDVNQHQTSWLQPSAAFFTNPSRWDPFPAATGPSNWPRAAISSGQLPRTPVAPAVVSNIKTTDNSVSFTVDQKSVGSPVLVKTSYFPNWHVSGAKGPYRVMPNFMVVIPTSTKVRLSYGYTPIDGLGWGLTLLALVGLGFLLRRPPLAVARRAASTVPGAGGPGGGTSDWLADERDPNLGWLWAAPDQPLTGPPGAEAQPAETGAPTGQSPGSSAASANGQATDGRALGPTAPGDARSGSATGQIPPPPPLPGANDGQRRGDPTLYDPSPSKGEATFTAVDLDSAEDHDVVPRRSPVVPEASGQGPAPTGAEIAPSNDEDNGAAGSAERAAAESGGAAEDQRGSAAEDRRGGAAAHQPGEPMDEQPESRTDDRPPGH